MRPFLRPIVVELVQGTAELKPERVLSCVFGVKEDEAELYLKLLENSEEAPFTVEDVAEIINRSRSTAQKMLQSLVRVGMVERERETLPGGGRRYLYRPAPWEKVKELGLGNLRIVHEEVEKWFREFTPHRGGR
ncbi:helix-turn-helix domain-containing protein [Methanopyrus sp. SNP6]|uniref:helix-turn-helix domain-containing protein n=1 Tax=Methanopyrus sp. SNP6 TaxID=1937005 RepID=UPI00143BEE04|nr:helix-turn-helix domain-containing protein [Methanopyrus sp. SNP6]